MKHEDVRRERDRLVADLPTIQEIVRGSLLKRTIRHSQGCKRCEQGGGHPVWVLTVSYPGGGTRQFSIKANQYKQVKAWVNNYRKLKAKLEAICELNHQLLRPEK
jgi:hypothetical protein